MTTAWEETARRPNPGRLTGDEVVLLLEFGMMGKQLKCAASWQAANNVRDKDNDYGRTYVCMYVCMYGGAYVSVCVLCRQGQKSSEKGSDSETASGPGITAVRDNE